MFNEQFLLDSDIDVYCWMKVHLPSGFSIAAEPSKNYYSEWQFRYLVYFSDGEILHIFEGDFKEIEKGSLVKAAKQLLLEVQDG